MTFRDVLLDLDGTLIDPRVGIIQSILFALAHFPKPIPKEEELLWTIGPPLLESFQILLGNAEEARLGVTHYRSRYEKLGMFENVVYPQIPEVLAELQGLGLRLHLATSKPHIYARPILVNLNLFPYFHSVYGSELDGVRSDKVELLRYIVQQERIDPSKAMMIGDRKFDILGARGNQMRSIGAKWGYGSVEELTLSGADFLIDQPDQIKEIICSI